MVYTQTYEQWSGRRKGGGRKIGRVAEVVKHTEAGADISPSATVAQEVARCRGIDNYHRSVRMFGGWIGYSAVDMPSGRVYEGRGFFRQTVATQGRNSSSAAICSAGHGDRVAMTEPQVSGVRRWIGFGIGQGAIAPDPLITGHRKYAPHKSCPGHKIFAQLYRLRGVTGPGAGGSPPAPAGPRTLRLTDPAMEGEDVNAWQIALSRWLGDPTTPMQDGSFGPKTNHWTQAFLRDEMGVETNSPAVGPKTLEAMRKALAGTSEELRHVTPDAQRFWQRTFDDFHSKHGGSPTSLGHILRFYRVLRSSSGLAPDTNPDEVGLHLGLGTRVGVRISDLLREQGSSVRGLVEGAVRLIRDHRDEDQGVESGHDILD